ncbi:TPA_asm: RNA-directed RNA polymerase [ssRNA phage Gerhypos.2_34]|uniref:RNA-directed RNA polymerase n=2 Tax=Fiersviridae TaxID=2842319 RepID=A0A8S5KYY2_9VIRU|nr:RNA-directed RNA polymerase [ssRNA phage Gerhypos.2_34]QDH91448.1 MAG: RNA-dependent RNA polymerase [Leviviridae sp.]DAD50367.1 TPA_asm: RNA-directed RNA polymerase [ssRNA phage Gerhypos.2_34]
MSSKKYGYKFCKELASYRVPSGLNNRVITDFYSALDCPRALTAYLLWKHGEHAQLAKLEFDPNSYSNMAACRDAYAATKFLSKYKGLTFDDDLDEVAFKKFEEFELLCKGTNARFRSLSNDALYKDHVVSLHSAVIRKIEKMLGEYSAEELFESPDWGPGASTLIKRREASATNKFQSETGITRDLHALITNEILEGAYPLWYAHLTEVGFPTYQVGNKVVTVPKDASTNRVIAIEPGMNLWFQKSVGDMIRRRLQRWGVDLSRQNVNQEFARYGSIHNSLATVDLSSASDSIAYSVVEELIPPRWFALLDSCRSPFGRLRDKQVKWEKFSSMGNGFTFELESLIFYAVAKCCAEYVGSRESVNSYGDDIVLPSSAFQVFSDMMRFYGFRINGKKSYVNSPFRESCGAHFYLGSDIKPLYLKDKVQSIPSAYRLANAIRRLANRRTSHLACDARFHKVFDTLVNSVPPRFRLRIPDGYGDGGFIGNLDEATPNLARDNPRTLGFEGYLVPNLVEVSSTYQDERRGYLLANLWALELRPQRGKTDQTRLQAIRALTLSNPSQTLNSVPSKERLVLKVSNSLVQQWSDLGPWVDYPDDQGDVVENTTAS